MQGINKAKNPPKNPAMNTSQSVFGFSELALCPFEALCAAFAALSVILEASFVIFSANAAAAFFFSAKLSSAVLIGVNCTSLLDTVSADFFWTAFTWLMPANKNAVTAISVYSANLALLRDFEIIVRNAYLPNGMSNSTSSGGRHLLLLQVSYSN